MDSDDQADILGQLDDSTAEAILAEMQPEEAADARLLLQYESNTAGGLMHREFLSFSASITVGELAEDLRDNQERYGDYNVQYIYVVDQSNQLTGVLRMRDLVMCKRSRLVGEIMIANPRSVSTSMSLAELVSFFDEHRFIGVPVVDEHQGLVGVIERESVSYAKEKQTNALLLRVSGIVGGEEMRSMPTWSRSARRLSWLSINIVLNIVAASVIAMYTSTLEQVIALAVFLPMISDMSGCSGNQAVAVSLRELSMGTVRSTEIWRVLFKEGSIGIINGLALGLLLGAVAMAWKGSFYLGLVVGGALAINTLVAVTVGGTLPLILRRTGVDPALVSGPVLTTITDMCGFFFALSFATAMMSHLV